MKKISLLFVFFSVGLFILCTAPLVFCESDVEIMHIDSRDLIYDDYNDDYDDDDLSLEATEGDILHRNAATKYGTLYVYNKSKYVVNIFLDNSSTAIHKGLKPNYKLTIKNVTQGSHKLWAMVPNSTRCAIYTYTQSSISNIYIYQSHLRVGYW